MSKFKVFSFLFLVLLIAIFWYVATGHYSSGDRAGTISKLSERGYVFKTYEGVLNEGGYSGETGSLQARYWDFSAKDEKIVEDLKKALATGERITLHYEEKFFQFPWNGDTKYFITEVKFLPRAARMAPERLLDSQPEADASSVGPAQDSL
ncbi:MAG: hypothetical protein ACK4LB_00340 [Spirosomataceae bacterium]